MAYAYVATTQQSTGITSSVVCSFTDSISRNLVVAKGNNLEFYSFGSDQLNLIKSISIYGRITKIDKLRFQQLSDKDSIFVLTAKLNFLVLVWDSAANQPIIKVTGSFNDRSGKQVESGHLLFIDPQYRMIGMVFFEGLIKIIPIESSGFKDAFDVRLDFLRPIDIKFLTGCGKPTICVLFEDDKNNRHMKSFVVEVKDRELSPVGYQQPNLDAGASTIIPVPSPVGGIIIVGENSVTYMNYWNNGNNIPTNSIGSTSQKEKNIQVATLPRTLITAWDQIDPDGSRYLLGDHLGTMYVLVLGIENNKVVMIAVNQLGKTNISQTIHYLDNGVAYIGSTFGDSQLIRLNKDLYPDGTCLDVLDSYTNIGPIVDMVVVTGERQGQSQLVTCSGAFQSGSLRILKSGIGINEVAMVEVEGLKDCWAIRSSDSSSYHKYLVQSYIAESRILIMENDEMEEVESTGGFQSVKSLYCGNIIGGLMVQVTSSIVKYLDIHNNFETRCEYRPNKPIILAHGNMNEIILALSGGELLSICLNNDQIIENSRIQFENDISCVSIQSLNNEGLKEDAMTDDSNEISSSLISVGLWTENTVRLLASYSLKEVALVNLRHETQVRDSMVVKLGKTTYLILGLGDGTLITYTVDISSSGLPVVSSRRKIVIGTTPVTLSGFYNNGSYCIFAACDRSTVIYQSYEKLLLSVVNIPEINKMTPFHSESFPESLCLISERGYFIGNIDTIQKIHIRTVDVHGTPRRICYNTKYGIYGVIIERTGIFEYGEETRSYLSFYDENTMEIIYEYQLQSLEIGNCIVSAPLSDGTDSQTNNMSSSSSASANIKLNDSMDQNNESNDKEYFIIGTIYGLESDIDDGEGRMLIFEVDEKKNISFLTEKKVNSSIHSICSCGGGKFAACIGSKVAVFGLKMSSMDTIDVMNTCNEPSIVQYASHQGYVLSLDIKAYGEFILVGDLLRSVTLLKFSSSTNELIEVARDSSAHFMRCVSILGDSNDFFLGADDNMNFFTVHRKIDAATVEEQSKLDLHGEYHIGDHVNCIRVGSLVGDNELSGTAVASHVPLSPARVGMTTNDKDTIESDRTVNIVTGMPSQTSSYLFGTISGMIGTILLLNEENYTFYSCLERSINSVIGCAGSLSHDEWRSFHNERKSSLHKYFIDGDLVETFVDLSRENQEIIVRQLNDELNSLQGTASTVTNNSIGTSPGSGNVHTLTAMASMLNAQEKCYQVEEVIRRVEDISRLH